MSQVELKTHYSAAELASMKLPGLAESRQGIEYTAKRQGWDFIEENGRGRGGLVKNIR